jgi:iron complex outermembrane receptor protein
MKVRFSPLSLAIQSALLIAVLPLSAQAQTAAAEETKTKSLETVLVTGSRIKQSDAVTQAPVNIITRMQIEKTGLASLGQLLQQLSAGGKALNAQFNSSGNFGFPPDGGGIGAGSSQVDLRNLGSKRVLVLVDGVRWVNESSASGVSGSADLNTIPLAIVERIEVLEDGASAIYGSDAIAGVINVITRTEFEGAAVHTYYGEYPDGGATKDANFTVGGSGDKFSAIFSGSFYDQNRISSADFGQSSFPIPFGGLAFGSSGTPQGRFVFCDPRQPVGTTGFCGDANNDASFYSITLNNGTTNPTFDPANPDSGSFHHFTGQDRFNYSPFNLLLTPSERRSLFTNVTYDLSDSTKLHVKALYNNRKSVNQAAPEPIFVGPGAGTGGIADTISISAANPFNPFGIELSADSNLLFIGRRPLEVGPRVFQQDVDTWYVNGGLDGTFDFGEHNFSWDVNFVHSENKANQIFTNGYNVAKLKLALGDPTICAQVAGCTPLDLFGGQARPFTQQMIDFIRVTTRDSSKQILDVVSANITGDLFPIGDRSVGVAAGFEHRRNRGNFTPDQLRQSGESQDSFASPIAAADTVDEVYGEVNVPVLASVEVSGALRYSDYDSTGGATTGKIGLRWQPISDLVLRGNYSEGFRAPNLGELFGLTQFGATLTDPCGPTNGALVVDAGDGLNTTPLETACRAQGVPNGFRQANTQIITFTGGNANLTPEDSKSYTAGLVYSPSWAEDLSWSNRLDLEVTYYKHTISGAIQARDIQQLLDACLNGTASGQVCSGFSRISSGDLRPPTNFLDNLGSIRTQGYDFKANWTSPEWGFGVLTAALQSTFVDKYSAVDADGNVSRRTVGIEVDDSAIPDWQTNVQLGWSKGDFDAAWNIRYIGQVDELCNGDLEGLPGCPTADSKRSLGATTYNDLQVGWNNALTVQDLRFAFGVNNLFDKDPPICLTCSLNGYDAGTYDLPGRFWYASLDYKF